jgi:hypothetical protein
MKVKIISSSEIGILASGEGKEAVTLDVGGSADTQPIDRDHS